jgi:hypothetical protein
MLGSEGGLMSNRVFSSLCAVTAFAAGASWAAASNNRSIDVTLGSATQVNGTLLSPGDYHFTWSGRADKVDVTIERDHKVVETTTAKLENRPQATSREEVISRTQSGSRVLEEVRLPGKTALVFAGS